MQLCAQLIEDTKHKHVIKQEMGPLMSCSRLAEYKNSQSYSNLLVYISAGRV